MSLAVVTLKKGEGRFLKSGGLWVYDNEIASIMGSFVNGDIVLVRDFDGYPMGRGFINTNSKITVRMLTRGSDDPVPVYGTLPGAVSYGHSSLPDRWSV